MQQIDWREEIEFLSKQEGMPDPFGFFVDTEDAVMSLVRELYDTDEINKSVIHHALWWLVSSFGEGSNERYLDHLDPEDLVIEHWTNVSIREHK